MFDPSKTLDLQLKKPDGKELSVTVAAETQTDKEFRAELKKKKDTHDEEPFKCQEISKELIACKLYSFEVEKDTIDKMMKHVHDYPKFILDLRGNGGGLVSTEQYLLSYFFERETKIADLVQRDKSETRMTKVLSADKQYKGKVAVLVDSNSASASEISKLSPAIGKTDRIFVDFLLEGVRTGSAVPFRGVIGGFSVPPLFEGGGGG